MWRNIMHIEAMHNNKDDPTKTTIIKMTTTRLILSLCTLKKFFTGEHARKPMKRWGYPAILRVSAMITLHSENFFTNKHYTEQAYKDNILE